MGRIGNRARWRGGLLDAPGERLHRPAGFGSGRGERSDGDAIGFKVRDGMTTRVAEHDRLPQHLEMAARVVEKMTADGVVIIQDEVVGGLALRAAEGLFQPAMKGRRRKRRGWVRPGTNGGDDHQRYRVEAQRKQTRIPESSSVASAAWIVEKRFAPRLRSLLRSLMIQPSSPSGADRH